MDTKYECILAIVNNGFSEAVMDAAIKCGARGGTVFNARGTAKKEAVDFFHINFSPEKEIVMLIVDSKIKDNILKEIYETVGIKTPGQGIAFSLPVSNAIGLEKQFKEEK